MLQFRYKSSFRQDLDKKWQYWISFRNRGHVDILTWHQLTGRHRSTSMVICRHISTHRRYPPALFQFAVTTARHCRGHHIDPLQDAGAQHSAGTCRQVRGVGHEVPVGPCSRVPPQCPAARQKRLACRTPLGRQHRLASIQPIVF